MPDPRLEALAKIVHPQRTVPTTMDFFDIAGLVKGASKGEGLGNKFLANIRECEAIAHVVRCFDNDDVIHVSGKVSPLQDIETIETELILADLDSVEKALSKAEKNAKSGNKKLVEEKQLLDALKQHLNDSKPGRSFVYQGNLDAEKIALLNSLHLLTTKPVMYIANVNDDGFENNPYLDQVRALAKQEGSPVVPVCAALEMEIADLADEEKQEFLESMGLHEPGLNRVIREGYTLLKLQTYFTAGVKEVRAWTISIGATAPQAAAVIHTDFEKGFIRAEVIAYDDFIHYKGEAAAKEAGKWRLEGKDYIVQDGDVVHFRFNV